MNAHTQVSPSPHRSIPAGGALPILFSAVALLDAVTTHWILAHGGVELNPLSVPWTKLGWWGTYAHQIVVALAVYGGATLTGRVHHWWPPTVYCSAIAGKLAPLLQHNLQAIL